MFVGYSESLRDIPELAACRAGDAIYYERRAPRRPDTDDGVPRSGEREATGPNRTPVPVAVPRSSSSRVAAADPAPIARGSGPAPGVLRCADA